MAYAPDGQGEDGTNPEFDAQGNPVIKAGGVPKIPGNDGFQTPAAPAAKPSFDRAKFQSDWLGTDAHVSADMDKFLQTHPEYAAAGVSRSGSDIWNLPDPRGNERVDALFDQGGTGSHSSWTDPGGGGGGGGQGGMGSLPPGGAAAMPAPASAAAGTGDPAMDAAMHTALMQLLERSGKPVTAASVGDQFGPVDAIVQRNADQSRYAAGERSAFQGSNVGGAGGSLDGEQNAISEKMSQDESGLMAGLIGDQLTAQRQDLVNALQFAQGEEKIQLQSKIADMDHQIAQQGVNNQSKSIDNSYALGQGQLGLGYSTLGQNDAHFYDNMDNENGIQQYMLSQIFNQNLAA